MPHPCALFAQEPAEGVGFHGPKSRIVERELLEPYSPALSRRGRDEGVRPLP